jgi:hypothetical protein
VTRWLVWRCPYVEALHGLPLRRAITQAIPAMDLSPSTLAKPKTLSARERDAWNKREGNADYRR